MTNESAQSVGGNTIDKISALLGKPMLLEGEDAAAYEALAQRILATVRPRDPLEELLLRDVIDQTWELLRYRRLRDAFLNAQHVSALEELLRVYCYDPMDAREVAIGWGKDDPEAVAEVDEFLADRSLDRSVIDARALAIHVDLIDRLERLIAGLEARRQATLRELERWRRGLGQDVARLADIEDLACEDVAPSGQRPSLS